MPDPGDTLNYRVGQAEKRIGEIDAEKADAKDVAALVEEVRSLKKILMVTASGIVLAAITFAFTVAQLLAHGG